MSIRSEAAKFEAKALAALTEASAALPALDELFPGSTQAAIDQLKARIEALVSEAESTMAGWAEAVAQASGNEPPVEQA